MEDKISFPMCRFKNDKAFESTARMALWKMLRIPNVYTLESSFLGFQRNEKSAIQESTPKDYKEIGRSVCIGLFRYLYEQSN